MPAKELIISPPAAGAGAVWAIAEEINTGINSKREVSRDTPLQHPKDAWRPTEHCMRAPTAPHPGGKCPQNPPQLLPPCTAPQHQGHGHGLPGEQAEDDTDTKRARTAVQALVCSRSPDAQATWRCSGERHWAIRPSHLARAALRWRSFTWP